MGKLGERMKITYHWDTESHGIESDRRNKHDHEDNPDVVSTSQP